MSNYNQISSNNFDTMQSRLRMSNSSFIKCEIERFDRVHPSIYSIYKLIDGITNQSYTQTHIREHVMIIEDAFVNNQEWTLNRSILDIRIGLLGTISCGKSSLVHRFLTSAYTQVKSPEGGRFKKEVTLDNQSYLLLIRDEANAPNQQFTLWIDGIIFVFSLESEESFKTMSQYYTQMNHYRNISDIPLILVGTQDAISETNPRVIHEDRARKLASEFKNCTYYETCSTNGLNVEQVFHDICQKVVQQRYEFSFSTLSSNRLTNIQHESPPMINQNQTLQDSSSVHFNENINLIETRATSSISSYDCEPQELSSVQNLPNVQLNRCLNNQTMNSILRDRNNQEAQVEKCARSFKEQSGKRLLMLNEIQSLSEHRRQSRVQENEQLIPTHKLKESKWKLILFTPGKRGDDKHKSDRLGYGRTIPIKQGFLYKKSTNSINRDWKKKYVVLLENGRIIYYPSLQDYENVSHGKEIILQHTTVKLPDSNKPRTVSQYSNTYNKSNDITSTDSVSGKTETLNMKKHYHRTQQSILTNSMNSSTTSRIQLNTKNSVDGDDNNIFMIVSLDKRWIFEAQSNKECKEWLQAINQQILSSLQNIESSKVSQAAKIGGPMMADTVSIQAIKEVSGNKFCADCDKINPTWASLNLGALICMNCASVHRNLGTHLSRVRSLELDEWPSELVQVMRSIGNKLVNSIWEINKQNQIKPQPNASSSERERWIRNKYELKLFIAPLTILPHQARQSLIDAIIVEDLYTIILLLVHRIISTDDPNTPLLHLAASQGNVTILQLLLWYGADPFLMDTDGRTPLECANGNCIQALQTLTNSLRNSRQQLKQLPISLQQHVFPRRRSSVTAPSPPHDKRTSTII